MSTDFEPEHEHLLDHEFAADDLDDEEHDEADSFFDDEYDDSFSLP